MNSRILSLATGLILLTAMSVRSMAANDAPAYSDTTTQAIALAQNDDSTGLQEFLADLNPETRIKIISELAANLKGKQLAAVLPAVIHALMATTPTDALAATAAQIMAAATAASEGNQNVVSLTIQSLIEGVFAHPSLDNEDDRLNAAAAVAEAAAAAAIQVAEKDDKDNIAPVNVAYAVARGGIAGVGDGEEAAARARIVGESLARGGIGAASEVNRPAVGRAMMLAMARIYDIEVRRSAAAGILAGAQEVGGDAVTNRMTNVKTHIDRMGAPPHRPGAPVDPVNPAEVSPF